MKKILIFTLVILTLTIISPAQEKETPESVPEVTITDHKSFWYATMDFQGSYKKMSENIFAFMGEFSKQELKPTEFILMGVFYNSPTGVKEDDLRWAVGFPVPADAVVKEPLKKVEFKKKKVAVHLHTGPYEQLEQLNPKLIKYLDGKGYQIKWPVIDRYLNSPMQVSPHHLKTEIIMPIEKK